MALVKYNNNSISSVTATAALASGAMTLIKSQTASSSASVNFIHGTSDVVLDSTYPIYLFKFINLHPASNAVEFKVNFRDGGSNYDATKTTTNFMAYHNESGSSTSLEYRAGDDLAQSTGDQTLGDNLGDDADASLSGYMFLFNPSSTVFVKHFIAQTTFMEQDSTPYTMNSFTAGYCNVTAAIDGVTFKMNSGNIDAGTIKLYGIKDS